MMTGCAGEVVDTDADTDSDSDTDTQMSMDTCEARFTVLQKDAYAERPGRTSELWPPHTTTALEFRCDTEEEWTTTSLPNHGTTVEEIDEDGTLLLDVMTTSSAAAMTPDELTELVSTYEACSCEEGTAFLSMDSLEADLIASLVGELSTYLEANLTCTGDTTGADVAQLLVDADIAGALAVIPDCTFATGFSWEGAFDAALATVGGALEDFHVCNNDAALQRAMWTTFLSEGSLDSCDATAATCSGPRWYFAP